MVDYPTPQALTKEGIKAKVCVRARARVRACEGGDALFHAFMCTFVRARVGRVKHGIYCWPVASRPMQSVSMYGM